jgi:uncharacterized protein YjiS (DUF1127 family)
MQMNSRVLRDELSPDAEGMAEQGRFNTEQLYLQLGLHQSVPDERPDPWWRAIPLGMAWVKVMLIEGFAAYGASMHPSCFDPFEGDVAGHRESVTTGRSVHTSYYGEPGETWHTADPGVATASGTPRRRRFWLSPIAVMSVFRRSRAAPEPLELDALDDRTLRDIGISRDERVYVVRRGARRE